MPEAIPAKDSSVPQARLLSHVLRSAWVMGVNTAIKMPLETQCTIKALRCKGMGGVLVQRGGG